MLTAVSGLFRLSVGWPGDAPKAGPFQSWRGVQLNLRLPAFLNPKTIELATKPSTSEPTASTHSIRIIRSFQSRSF
jgi:hypothetical protein